MEAPTSDLMAIGFTEYEARVYIALLREYPVTGYQIGKTTGMTRSIVYEVLGRLHARGAVLKTEEQGAALYRPLPPDVLLQQYEQEQTRVLRGLRDTLGALYAASDHDGLWTITGRAPSLAYAARMIEDAASELMLVVDDAALEELRDAIERACARGIAVSTLLTGVGELSHGQVARHPPLESEIHHLGGMLVVVADSAQTLIASGGREMSTTVTGNHNLVLIARQFIWMELFTQRIARRLDRATLARLDAADRKIFDDIVDGYDDDRE